jgi:molybdopterin-biosynthesis enzyme MoeA-like protein
MQTNMKHLEEIYSAAGMRIAMRTTVNDTNDTLNWLFKLKFGEFESSFLGSTSMVADN